MTSKNIPDWVSERLLRCSSQNLLSVCSELWRHLSNAERPHVFAYAYGCGDLPAADRAFVLRALGWLRKRGVCAFDGTAARRAFKRLPNEVTIYRGTVESEVRRAAGRRWPVMLGTSWTLDEDRAQFFASEHDRFRNLESPPVILTTRIPRDEIGALLFERKEQEIVIHPACLNGRRVLLGEEVEIDEWRAVERVFREERKEQR